MQGLNLESVVLLPDTSSLLLSAAPFSVFLGSELYLGCALKLLPVCHLEVAPGVCRDSALDPGVLQATLRSSH